MMLGRIPHMKDNRRLRIEPFDLQIGEIPVEIEREPVDSRDQRRARRQELPDTAIVVRSCAAELAPAVFRTDFQHDGHAARRPPTRGVEHVSGDAAHGWISFKSSFSSLRFVIFRCSSAAMCISMAGSLSSRWRNRLSISAAVLPVAQTMKI